MPVEKNNNNKFELLKSTTDQSELWWAGFPLEWQVTSWSTGDQLIDSVARRPVRSPVSQPGKSPPAGGPVICRLLPGWAEPLRRDVSSMTSHQWGSWVVHYWSFIFNILILMFTRAVLLSAACWTNYKMYRYFFNYIFCEGRSSSTIYNLDLLWFGNCTSFNPSDGRFYFYFAFTKVGEKQNI